MGDSLESVFQGIYKSIVEAQNTIEQHYVGEVKEDYFERGLFTVHIIQIINGKTCLWGNLIDGTKK